MSVDFVLNAEARTDAGKGASRRLRRAGRVPAIIYGGKEQPESLSVSQHEIVHQLENEAFYSSILNVKIGGHTQRAILRDLQRHPFKPLIMHVDLQRVSEDQAIKVHVPLRFINEEACRGVKQEGGAISHLLIELEISCLPRDLPEFIEVDVADLGLGDSLRLSELKIPDGVEIVQSGSVDEDHDPIVVNVHHVHVAEEPEDGADDEAQDNTAQPSGEAE